MAGKTHCAVKGCEKQHHAKGLCGMHGARLRRSGTVEGSGRTRLFSADERFSSYSARDSETGCLVWMGAKQANGYGVMTRTGGGMMRAHRYAWEAANGPIPDGAWIDHACHRRDCVEVSHLRLANAVENGANRSVANRNTSTGVRNVHVHEGKYRVRVQAVGKFHDGGLYLSLGEAAEAAARLRTDLFGDFAGKGGAL